MATEYGKFMKKDEVSEMFRDFRKLKVRTKTNLAVVFKDDEDANRYFTGEDCVFVFTKQILKNLMERLSDDNGHVIIYQGLKSEEDSDAVGRPTLIVCGYEKNGNSFEFVAGKDVKGVANGEDALQHPGGGGGKTGSGLTAEILKPPYAIKDKIPVSEIQKMFPINM